MKRTLNTSGFQTISLSDEDHHLDLTVDKNRNVKLIVPYGGIEGERCSRIEVHEGSSLVLLMKNNKTSCNRLKQEIYLHKDASLTIAYWEIEDGESMIDVHAELLESGSQILIRSACIAKEKKKFTMQCTHHQSYTQSQMENYAIIEDQGNYRMYACGKIEKGAFGSASHQTSRVLTLTNEHTSEVIPVLLINENDVKASHATTVGQPNEDQLYYLQSRGLNRTQALGLLTVGYLMPISELFEDENYQREMKDEIEKRVGLHA